MAFGNHAAIDANKQSHLCTFYEINYKSIGNQSDLPNELLLKAMQYEMHICKFNLAHSRNSIRNQLEIPIARILVNTQCVMQIW